MFSLSYQLSYICFRSALHKSLVYPPFIYILYDECSEDVRGKYVTAKYSVRNSENLKTLSEPKKGIFKKHSDITYDQKFL